MKNDNILVSVVCDVYNHEPYLRQCFDGFVMQKTNFKFEVLVHDDASTDKSAEIIIEYTNKYPDIFKPIIQKENQYSKGVGIWKTYQFPRVKGKYVAFCEGDDYWIDPLKLQKQVDILETKDIVLVYTNVETVDENGRQQFRFDFWFNSLLAWKGHILPNLLYRNTIMTVSCILKKEILESSIVKECNVSLDYLYFLSAAVIGKIEFLNDKTCCYRKNSSSLTNTSRVKIQSSFMKVWNYFVYSYVRGKIVVPIPKSRMYINILALVIDQYFRHNSIEPICYDIPKKDICIYIIPALFIEMYYLLRYYTLKFLKSFIIYKKVYYE